VRKLERSRDERVLFGVCGGLARYLGADPDLIRVGWIATVVLGGVGILPYIAAVFLVPESREETARSADRMAKNLGLLLVGLSGFAFLRAVGVLDSADWGFAFWGFRFLVPLLLLAGGVVLVWPSVRGALGFSTERKLERAVTDRVLAGVAGGIGHAARIDPNVVRLVFVFAAVLTSGIAVLLYLLLIVVIPEEPLPDRTETGGTATAAGPDQGPPEPGR
jgi:phage shock protein C